MKARNLSLSHFNKLLSTSHSTCIDSCKTIRSRKFEVEENNKSARHIQQLIDNCSDFQKKLLATKDSFCQNQENQSHYVNKIISKNYEESKPFYKNDKEYIKGKLRIAHKKEIQEKARKAQKSSRLSWDQFSEVSKEFEKREFGKINSSSEDKRHLSDLYLSTFNLTSASEFATSPKVPGYKKQEKLIFGRIKRDSVPSLFDKKMRREITMTLKKEAHLSTDFNSPDIKEPLSAKETKAEYEKIIMADFKKIRTFTHKINLEKIVRLKLKRLLHSVNQHFPLINLNNRL
ncbi:unnamed protein product [Blepharisma stoltei]|uniref:Uncharacterized protein n=1 Tax=Blepharisma stoltei TaxID=1481888 RepID=A0AAU9J7M5_9CILI|nr:unnamed protein product [Blepharisma stoltei]